MSQTVHVVPVDDLIEHNTAGDEYCICGPDIEPIADEQGSVGYLVSHHSLDGREAHE